MYYVLATFYYPNGGYGACGNPIQNTDYAVALNTDSYASGANCGRQISVSCKTPPVLLPRF